jgi:hypothetical protein
MSNYTLFGQHIKSFQTGTTTENGGRFIEVDISAVNKSKSIVFYMGMGRVANGASRGLRKVYFHSTEDKIIFERDSTSSSTDDFVATWVVIEFIDSVSVQSKSGTTSSTVDVTINSVEINKSLLFISNSATSTTTNGANVTLVASFVDSTTVNLFRTSTGGNVDYQLFVVTFP